MKALRLLPTLVVLALPGLGLADDLCSQDRLGAAVAAWAAAFGEIACGLGAIAALACHRWQAAAILAGCSFAYWLAPLLYAFAGMVRIERTRLRAKTGILKRGGPGSGPSQIPP